MSGIDFNYVDLWLMVQYLELEHPHSQTQKDLDAAIDAWFRHTETRGGPFRSKNR